MEEMVEKRSGVMENLGESPEFGLKCLWPRRAEVRVILVPRRRRSRERRETREREKQSGPRVPFQRRLLPPLPPRSPPRRPPLSSSPWKSVGHPVWTLTRSTPPLRRHHPPSLLT